MFIVSYKSTTIRRSFFKVKTCFLKHFTYLYIWCKKCRMWQLTLDSNWDNKHVLWKNFENRLISAVICGDLRFSCSDLRITLCWPAVISGDLWWFAVFRQTDAYTLTVGFKLTCNQLLMETVSARHSEGPTFWRSAIQTLLVELGLALGLLYYIVVANLRNSGPLNVRPSTWWT